MFALKLLHTKAINLQVENQINMSLELYEILYSIKAKSSLFLNNSVKVFLHKIQNEEHNFWTSTKIIVLFTFSKFKVMFN